MGRIKLLQINVDRRVGAQDLALQTATSLRADFIARGIGTQKGTLV